MADVPLLTKVQQAHEDDEAHEHLSSECPWYRAVCDGENPTDWAGCKPAEGSSGAPRLVVKFTPRTPEASTVDQPTVPPGGPGLFHVKGLHLPPYVQHLYKHLVGRYGKHGAYRVAVGVVKKWAQGVNPGGWKTKSGKGKRTHPDVRAAAQRNVAEWEADKAKAHEQSREHEHVKASATPSFPGQAQLPLPPVPHAQVSKTMFTAHRLDDVLRDLAHAAERLRMARKNKDQRAYMMLHVNNHLSHALDDMHALVDNLRTNYPQEAREIDALVKTMGLSKSVSPEAKVATFAHLTQTVLYHLAHAKRHALLMQKLNPDKVWEFNYDHAEAHTKGALEHSFKLAQHVADNYPAEDKWFQELEDIEDPDTTVTGLAAQNMGTATAPGAKPFAVQPSQYGLYQRPSQTTSPSPPLPPKVKVPTPEEVRALIPEVPECVDVSLSNGLRKFLETAAVKLSKDDEIEALSMLRSAQSTIYSAHKKDLGVAMPAVYSAEVFTRVPPAATSSAATIMLESRRRAEQWRKLSFQVAGFIDRIRKRFFHGHINGPLPNLRMSVEDVNMGTALDKFLALASMPEPPPGNLKPGPIPSGGLKAYGPGYKDVSFPVKGDTDQQAKLVQPEEMLERILEDPEVRKEIVMLPDGDRARIQELIAGAQAIVGKSPSIARTRLAAARAIALEAESYKLAKQLIRYLRAMEYQDNYSWTPMRL